MEPRLKKFKSHLAKFSKIALDTPCLLYHVEQNPKYVNLTEIIFEEVLPVGRIQAIASTLLLTETLAGPFADNRMDLIFDYKSMLLGFPNLTLYPLSAEIAERAGFLRGVYRLGTPDAIHIATAIEQNASAILTNDAKWKRVKEIAVLVLDDYY